ncbi:DUF6600 domain-containing protein, partial [Mucilaginibacter sp. L3T2-6]|uniref:DUF6600 domain-containing protein n=1 Tax=Mucilaginibacter sp. L3T2-6 TaxID=3062491 RepID=UPI002675C309
MKKILYLIPVAALLSSCSPIIYTSNQQPVYDNQEQYAEQPVDDQVFYDELSPYGQWIDYPDYGYVWQPYVDEDFRPYETNGSWVYTDEGWTWASNYSWGWAPFHYGRWFYDGGYGWMWLPGGEWAPAWVTWGQSGDYYGWAPLPPNVGYGRNWRPRGEDWCYVHAGYMTRNNINRYVVRNNITVINNTTIINNIYTNNYNYNRGNGHRGFTYNRGPRVTDVESRGHYTVRPVTIGVAQRPGEATVSGGRLNVYRPVINREPSRDGRRPAPQQVSQYDNKGDHRNAGRLNPFNPKPEQLRPNPQPGQQNNPQQGNKNSRPVTGQGQQKPGMDNGRGDTNPQQAQPRPVQEQPRPVPQQAQPRPVQEQPRPVPQQPQPRPVQEQPRPVPQQPQPRPVQEQPRPVPQQPQPRSVQEQPRPVQQQPQPRPVQGQPRPVPQQPQPRPVQEQPRPVPQQPQPR